MTRPHDDVTSERAQKVAAREYDPTAELRVEIIQEPQIEDEEIEP